jgi:hypothetical protein
VAANQIKLKILNPRGIVENTKVVSPAPRLKTFKGKKITLLKNRIQVGQIFYPLLEKALKDRMPEAELQVRENSVLGDPEARLGKLQEIAGSSDAVIVAMGISGGSTTRTTPDAVKIEKMGKPVALIVCRCFKSNARFNAMGEGLEDLAVATLITDYVPPVEEAIKLKIAEKVADEVARCLTEWTPQPPEMKDVNDSTLEFTGSNLFEAQEQMERFFLNHGWSDGFPLVPPTEEAVKRMLEGCPLPREHVISIFPPSGAKLTVEKIAVNAVMAGCLPQYLPVVMAAVETIIDPLFDLVGAQCTSGQMAPLFIVSGHKLINELNINDSFCTVSPGWKANVTIGRALKLIMMNIGHTWPGLNDMKAFGNPFRFYSVIGENEAGYSGVWDPLRVVEGYPTDQPTISVMPAMSWQPDLLLPTPPSVDRIIAQAAIQAKSKYDRYALNCVYDNLLLISPTAFDAIRREGLSRSDLQQKLYEVIQLPGNEVFDGREGVFNQMPQWVIEKHKQDPAALVPILLNPQKLRICVTGGPGPDMIAYIGTWGYGPCQFVTKPIQLPTNWNELLAKYKGWESPTIR